KLHGPYTKKPNHLYVKADENGVLFHHLNKKDETKFDVYWNWEMIGQYDLVHSGLNYYKNYGKSEACYFYLEDGINKLGYGGKEIGRANSKIFKACKNGKHFIYADQNSDVYINGE